MKYVSTSNSGEGIERLGQTMEKDNILKKPLILISEISYYVTYFIFICKILVLKPIIDNYK